MAKKIVPLPDGRPFPRALADRQFGHRALALLTRRLDTFAELPAFFLAGRPLTAQERFELLAYLQRTLLPEVYDGPDAEPDTPDADPEPDGE